MSDFREHYSRLNTAQKTAVDTIEGPVLVIAGPGTGKTQLLSMRAANIVQQTDAGPGNILCLTFTESAALAMRKRLISLMGTEGNKVAVHTFHNFGADIINQNPEYFYNGARFSPADELASYEVLRGILADLPHSNPLAKTMNGEFTALADIQQAISHLKRAGLTPSELRTILDHNQEFCDFAEPLLAPLFAARLSKKDFLQFAEVLQDLRAYRLAPLSVKFIKPLASICAESLAHALAEAETSGKTTALTAWRNDWMEKNHLGVFVFKDRARTKKLRPLAKAYSRYRDALLEQELFDFDDMVSLVAHTLEQTPELRFNLQERFLYIMVDEFQDTNGAQLRLLNALADNPVHEGRPNILAVGDDDQAIYSFQGAELSNILSFTETYRDPAIITLTDNYRSTDLILQEARGIITQSNERLETVLGYINKTLTAHAPHQPVTPELHEFAGPEAEYQWVAERIKAQIDDGTPPQEIAVLARNHRQLVALLPYLHAQGIKVAYERRSNVLESPHICELITLVEVVVAISEQRFDKAEELLPELLSFNFWGLKTSDIWQLSLESYKQRRLWLELMLEGEGKLHTIAEFLVVAAHQALHEPLEIMLDNLLGTNEQQVSDDPLSEPFTEGTPGPDEDFISPYRAYYFNERRLHENPAEYLTLLSNLRAIRTALCHYRPDQPLGLRDFTEFIALHERTKTPIMDTSDYLDDTAGVELMTAHKSKGLEFTGVFIINSQDDIWGRSARHPYSSLRFPHNLPIEPAGSTYDDALRLYFVAMTRAKQRLHLSYYTRATTGRETLRAEFLQHLASQSHTAQATPLEQLSPGWQQRHLGLPKVRQEVLLKPTLEVYRLSATHVNNFLDVTRGGPQAFLLQNLLRFPQAMTREQVFGHAIHTALQRAHNHLAATGNRRPVEDILHDFEQQLHQSHLSERNTSYLLEKGSEVLGTYLAARYDTFTPRQKAERNFASQHVVVGDVRLTGAIDLLEVDETTKTVVVTDYKTGKGHSSWRGTTDYEKIKLHKYKQQLMLYKLLLENSRDFTGYTVTRGVLEFVEADPDGQLHQLELHFDPYELHDYTRLLGAMWNRIMQLNFPDTSHYKQDYTGILQFEEDLCT